MADRSFAGFEYQQRLCVGFYGEVYRGRNSAGQEVRITNVDRKLTSTSGFTTALAKYGGQLGKLDHARVVATRTMGRGSDGGVVVVTSAVSGPVTCQEIVTDAGALPAEVALAIVIAAAEGLGYAHSLGLIHGALHPQSVLIAFDGGVKVADFGLGRAMAVLAANQLGVGVHEGLTSYLAPELSDGGEATILSDVFGLGMLLRLLVTGSPTGSANLTPGVKAVMDRAIAIDPHKRFINGSEVEEALEAAMEADSIAVATSEEIAKYVTSNHGVVEASLDAVTGDVLSDIHSAGDDADVAGNKPPRRRGVTDILAGLDAEVQTGTSKSKLPPLPQPKPEFRPELQAAAASADDAIAAITAEVDADERERMAIAPTHVANDDEEAQPIDFLRENTSASFDRPPSTGEMTAVDDLSGIDMPNDPISDMLAMEDKSGPTAIEVFEDRTPLPNPRAHHESAGSVTKALDDLADEEELSKEDVGNAAFAALADLGDEDSNSKRRRSSSPRHKSQIATGPATPLTIARQAALNKAEAEEVERDAVAAKRAAEQAAEKAAAAVLPASPKVKRDVAVDALGNPVSATTALIPRDDGIDTHQQDGGRPVLWVGVIAFVLASLFGVIYTQTDIFQKDRAELREDERLRADEALRQKLIDEQIKSGEVVLNGTADAAVWLLLGRTPTESFEVSSAMLHELRFEHEGYVPLDLQVTGSHWSTEDKSRIARVTGHLVAGKLATPVGAYPPAPANPPAPGPPGSGFIKVESNPPGAQAWLLVGFFTPEVRLSDIPAGREYEFKVARDGYRPGFIMIREDDWYLAGPGSPVRSNIQRRIDLVPVAQEKPGGKKQPR